MSPLRSIPIVLLVAALGACVRPLPPQAPAPAAPPEPAPTAGGAAGAAAKAQPPAEEHLQFCALAPTSSAGLRTLEAVHVPGSRDTLAVEAKGRIPLSEAVSDARVASQATWFQSHLFLDLKVGGITRHFAIYDLGRVIEPADLAYLGTVDGLPVYAAAADVAPIKGELASLLGTERDLPKLLLMHAPLRATVRRLSVLYVPLAPTGCVFQPLLRVEVPES